MDNYENMTTIELRARLDLLSKQLKQATDKGKPYKALYAEYRAINREIFERDINELNYENRH